MNDRDEIRARLERIVVTALADAGAALLGEAPQEVCAVLAEWRAQGRQPLPWAAGPLLSALAPLGVASDGDPATRTVGRLLVGAETDPIVAQAAVAGALGSMAAGNGWGPLPADPEAVPAAVVRRALERDVSDAAALLVRTAAAVHRAIRAGRREQAVALLEGTREQLARDVADTRVLVQRVGGTRASIGRPGPGPIPTPPRQGRRARRRSPETVEFRRVRDRPVIPVVFLVVVTGVAAVYLWSLFSGQPLPSPLGWPG